MKYCFIFLVTCFSYSLAFGQTVVKGRVFEYQTHVPLSGIQVKNIYNREFTTTDKNGQYSLRAKIGEILVFSAFSYLPDSLVVTDLREKELFLIPKQNVLSSVNVTSSAADLSSLKLTAAPLSSGGPVNYQRDAAGNYKGGVSLALPWDKDSQKHAEEQKLEADNKVKDRLDAAFALDEVAKYVPLKGADLANFIELYRPDVKTFTAKNFVMLDYLNTCYQKFLKLPADKRHLTTLENKP